MDGLDSTILGELVDFPELPVVYLKHDPEMTPGRISAITLAPSGVTYDVSWGDRYTSTHHPYELTTEKPL